MPAKLESKALRAINAALKAANRRGLTGNLLRSHLLAAPVDRRVPRCVVLRCVDRLAPRRAG